MHARLLHPSRQWGLSQTSARLLRLQLALPPREPTANLSLLLAVYPPAVLSGRRKVREPALQAPVIIGLALHHAQRPLSGGRPMAQVRPTLSDELKQPPIAVHSGENCRI
jgi:hypothetical protein